MATGPDKAARMTLRRAIGTRADPKPRVSATKRDGYYVAHACFACRKSWKLARDAAATCPQCGGPLQVMGRSFKAPRQSDAEQWEKVRLLWEHGFRFFSYRSYPDAEALPDRLRDVLSFVARNSEHPFRVGDRLKG